MGIEHLKIWHWCILGILAGAGVGFAKLSVGVPEPTGQETVDLNVFEDYVLANAGPERRPFYEIRNVRMHPGYSATFDGEPYITYDLLLEQIVKPKPANNKSKPADDKPKLADVLPRITRLSTPGPKKHALTYVRDRTIAEKLDKLHASIIADKLTVSQYLDKLNEIVTEAAKAGGRFAKATPVQYKFNWWETPKATYGIYASGGFVVIGLIFPTLIQLLTVAGYGRQPKEKNDYNLDRFSGEEPQVAKAVIVDEKEQLAALEAELEAKLKAGASDGDGEPKPTAAPAKPVIAKLTAGKLEAAKEVEAAKPVRKGYGADQGDYYPTEVHGKNKP
jgi:hypothetical protein